MQVLKMSMYYKVVLYRKLIPPRNCIKYTRNLVFSNHLNVCMPCVQFSSDTQVTINSSIGSLHGKVKIQTSKCPLTQQYM